MPEIRQGEVWWVNFAALAGRRPALILTRNSAIARMMRVTVAPLTRTIRGIDSEVVLTPEVGVPSLCAVSLDNLMTISKQLLERRIIALPADVIDEVFEAIRFAFDMP